MATLKELAKLEDEMVKAAENAENFNDFYQKINRNEVSAIRKVLKIKGYATLFGFFQALNEQKKFY